MMYFIIAGVFACVLAADYLPRSKQVPAREKIVYLAVFLAGLTVLVLQEAGVDVPSPTPPIRKAVEALFGVQ